MGRECGGSTICHSIILPAIGTKRAKCAHIANHINVVTILLKLRLAAQTLFHFFESTDKHFELDIEFIAKNKFYSAQQSPASKHRARSKNRM